MTKFLAGTMLISQVMDCQVHAIGKAIRSLSQIRSQLSAYNLFAMHIALDAVQLNSLLYQLSSTIASRLFIDNIN